MLRRLSVFANGWTLEAAEAMCPGDGVERVEVLGLMARLVDKSLVVVGEHMGQARYRMLETIRNTAARNSPKPARKKNSIAVTVSTTSSWRRPPSRTCVVEARPSG